MAYDVRLKCRVMVRSVLLLELVFGLICLESVL